MSGNDYGLESSRVMTAANALLKMRGLRQRLVSCTKALERAYQYRTSTGKTVVVPVARQHGVFTGIRSILQRVRENRPCNWLINGQADTNMKELAFFGGYQAVIRYDKNDSLEFQYELMKMDGRSHEETVQLANDRMDRLMEHPDIGELPVATYLELRDEHDRPQSHPL